MPTAYDFSLNGIAYSFINHAPLAAGIAIIMWWIFPKMQQYAMRNGGGSEFRKIVREENADQVEETRKMIREEIASHEKVEEANMKTALMTIKQEIEDDGDQRFERVHEHLTAHDSRLVKIEARLFKASKA